MRGDRQNHTRSPCRPVTHLLSHERTNFGNQKTIREMKRTRQESKHIIILVILLEHRTLG